MSKTLLRELIAQALAEWEFRQKLHPKEFLSAFVYEPSDKALERVDFALAALAALAAAGYVIVPMEPTEAMIEAARDPSVANGSPMSKGPHEVWRAMTRAVPTIK